MGSEFIIKNESEEGHAITDGMLADHMEALIGAVCNDRGFDKAETFVLKFWESALDNALKLSVQPSTSIPKPVDKKVILEVASGSVTVTQVHKSPILNHQDQSRLPLAFSTAPLSPRSQRLFITSNTCSLFQYEQYIKGARDIDVNNIGKKGDTPLMTFLKKSEKKINSERLAKIEALYKAGASLDKPNRKGETARQLIEKNPHKDAIKNKLGLK